MNKLHRKSLVGVFFLACSYTLQANTLSQRLWSELDIAKAPIETNPSEATPESKNQEELSPADLAFMEGEFQEDTISTSLAAPVRKEEKTTRPTVNRKSPYRIRSRGTNVSPRSDFQFHEKKTKKIRERSR
jgi:hypothetical protein